MTKVEFSGIFRKMETPGQRNFDIQVGKGYSSINKAFARKLMEKIPFEVEVHTKSNNGQENEFTLVTANGSELKDKFFQRDWFLGYGARIKLYRELAKEKISNLPDKQDESEKIILNWAEKEFNQESVENFEEELNLL